MTGELTLHQRAVLSRLRRRKGATQEQADALEAHNATMEWWAKCPKCHLRIKGSSDELMKHRCGHD